MRLQTRNIDSKRHHGNSRHHWLILKRESCVAMLRHDFN